VVIVGANILAISLEKTFRGRGLIRFLILLRGLRPSRSAPSDGNGSLIRSTA